MAEGDGEGDPSQKTTLGGVPKQTFRPNLTASRKKKQASSNTAFDRLLQAEEEPLERQPHRGFGSRPSSSSSHGVPSASGIGAGCSSSGGGGR